MYVKAFHVSERVVGEQGGVLEEMGNTGQGNTSLTGTLRSLPMSASSTACCAAFAAAAIL